MVCAAPWKTCNCPWFNYVLDKNDRLDDMRVPYVPREDVVEDREIPLDPAPAPIRRLSTQARHQDRERAKTRSYSPESIPYARKIGPMILSGLGVVHLMKRENLRWAGIPRMYGRRKASNNS